MDTRHKAPNKRKQRATFDHLAYLSTVGVGRSITHCQTGHKIFSQGDPSDAVFYIQNGRVMLTAKSKGGKEAVITIRGPQCFFGDAWIVGQTVRHLTATAIAPCSLLRIEKNELLRVLREEVAFSHHYISYMVSRNIRIEQDLLAQFFDSSEKRLARILLLLANYGPDGNSEDLFPEISQALLAKMVGTTRSRISFFMNKFRNLGLIDYSGEIEGQMRVHSSLLHVVQD